MAAAARQLAADFLSTIVYLAVYLGTGRIELAVGVAVAAALVQLALMRSRGRAIDAMQWMSLALVLTLGGIALVTGDARIVLMKPALAHFAVGGVMLRRGWMTRYLPEIVRHRVPDSVIVASGYAWAALMGAIGAVLLAAALLLDFRTTAWLASAGAIGATAAAFLVQFLVFRASIRNSFAAERRAK